MRALVFVGLLALSCGTAQAQWQEMKAGRYIYWQDGETQAFPVGNNGFIYYKVQGQAQNQWTFYHPISVHPQTGEVIYNVIWTDGSRIARRYTTDAAWTEIQSCDLAVVKQYRDGKYQAFIANMGTDHRAFYQAEHFEADRVFSACRQIQLRAGR